MASKTLASIQDHLNYVFRGVQPAWDGATTLYLSLHIGAVGLGGDQQTNEVAYDQYARVAITRGTGAWTVPSGDEISNSSLIQFAKALTGTFPIAATHIGVGTSASGAGEILHSAAMDGSGITINVNSQPQFLANALKAKES
jgi:hypothetical protein